MDLQRFAGERTEQATPRRREEARRRGQVARSPELAPALLLLGVFGAFTVAGAGTWDGLAKFMHDWLTQLSAARDLAPEDVQALFPRVFLEAAKAALPVALVALVIGLVAEFVQVGFHFSLQPLVPNFDRINPLSGLQRMFSRRSLFELAKSLVKAGIVGFVTYRVIRQQADALPQLAALPLPEIAALIVQMTLSILLQAGLALLVLAGLDYWFQRYEFEQSIMMTRQEVKEEMRQSEGDPRVRSRLRERQRALARRRMMQEVPRADVVVTNPTHYAVALRYDAQRMAVPEVVAKGQGFLALKIREVAEQNGVTVVEKPPLARALYAAVEVGQGIPSNLYQAVAEVLAFVYQLRAQKKGQQAMPGRGVRP